MNIKPLGVPFFKNESARCLLGALDVMKRTHSMRFSRLKKILKNFGLLWQALKKFNGDNGFFSSSGIAFNILIGIDFFMILLAGILLLVSMILSPVVTFLQAYQGRIPVAIGPTIQWILKYLLPFCLTCCMFFLIYKIIPNRRVQFKSALQAALFTGLLWELAKHLFTWYVVHLAGYSIFYGSLSTLVIFVLWVYYSSTILVLGGEFAYFLDEDRQRSTV